MVQHFQMQSLMVVLRLMNSLHVLVYIYTMYQQLIQHHLGSMLIHQLYHQRLVLPMALSMRDRLQVFATGTVRQCQDHRLYPCSDLD